MQKKPESAQGVLYLPGCLQVLQVAATLQPKSKLTASVAGHSCFLGQQDLSAMPLAKSLLNHAVCNTHTPDGFCCGPYMQASVPYHCVDREAMGSESSGSTNLYMQLHICAVSSCI